MYSLIITDYKSMSDTVDYIKKFIDIYVGNDVHYIIVDNSAEELGKQFLQDSKVEFTSSTFNGEKVYSFEISQRKIYIIDSNENGGYSKGNNLGAKFAIQNFNTPYLVFSNNDLEFPNGIQLNECKTIVETSDHPIGIVGPKILTPQGDIQSPRKRMNFVEEMILQDYNRQWFNSKIHKWMDIDYTAPEGETGWVSGSFMFVSRNAFEAVSGFDENIFLYCEEMILSERMRNKGYMTYFYPEWTIYHYHRGAHNPESEKIGRVSKKYYYREYRGASKLSLKISDMSYFLCKKIYRLKKILDGTYFKEKKH